MHMLLKIVYRVKCIFKQLCLINYIIGRNRIHYEFVWKNETFVLLTLLSVDLYILYIDVDIEICTWSAEACC